MRKCLNHYFFRILFFILLSVEGFGASATWISNANANWSDNSRWSPAAFPNGIDDVASFLSAITANRNVSVNTSVTVGSLVFNNLFNYSLNLAGGNTITFQTSSGNGSIQILNTTANSATNTHQISANLSLTSFVDISQACNKPFNLNCAISGAGGLNISSSSTGAIVMLGGTANTFSGLTTINSGSLNLSKTAGINAIAGDILINGGTLQLINANQIANTSNVTISSGTFDMNAKTETINSLTFNSGTLTQGGATLSLNAQTGALTMRNTIISGDVTLTSATSLGDDIIFDNTNNGTASISGNLNLFTGAGSITRTFNIADGSADVDMDVSGVISQSSGSASVTKTGSGTLQFSGASANTYSGNTDINAGALRAAKNTAFVSGTTVTVASGAALEATGGITNNPVLSLSGSGVGGNGALRNISGNNTFSNTVGLASPVTIQSDAGTLTLSNVISGAQPLTKSGNGTLLFSGGSSNTYSGLTTISLGTLQLDKTAGQDAFAGDALVNGGTLQLINSNQIPDTSNVTISSGTFDLNANAETINSLTFNSGTLTQGGATLSLNAQTGALTMRNTTISGAVTLTSATSLGDDIIFDNTNNGTASISGNLNLFTGAGSITRTFNIADGSADVDMDVSGIISQSAGSASVTKTGSGTLQFSGASANTYSGNTNINAGALRAAKNTAFVSGTTVTVASGAALEATGGITNNPILSLSGSGVGGNGALRNISGNNTFSNTVGLASPVTIQSDAGTLTLSNVISGAQPLTKSGNGTLLFSGGSSNTYSGLTTISSGTLQLDKTAGLDAFAGDALVNGGTLQLVNSNQIPDTSTVTISSGTFDLNSQSETIKELIFTNGSVDNLSSLSLNNGAATSLSMGDVNLPTSPSSGSIALTGAAGGTDIIYSGSILGNISADLDLGINSRQIQSSNLGAVLNISGIISGTGANLTILGPGTVRFSGSSNNSYSNLTTVSSGILQLNKTSGINAIIGDITINGGTVQLISSNQIIDNSTVTLSSGTFDLNNLNETFKELIFSGGSLNNLNSLTLNHSADTSLVIGDVNLPSAPLGGNIFITSAAGGTDIIYNGATLGNISANLDLGVNSRQIQSSNLGAVLNISGIISGTGADLTISGPGTLEFSGSSSNSYSNLTTVSSGILQLNKTSGINAISGDVAINGGTLLLSNSNQIKDTSTVTLSSGTFDLNNQNETIKELIFTGGTLSNLSNLSLNNPSSTSLIIKDVTIPSGNILLTGTSGGVDIIYNGPTLGCTINSNLDLGSSQRIIQVEDGAAAVDLDISGVISAGSIRKIDAGTLQFSGTSPNTYSGLTTVSAGSLLLNKSANINAIAGDVLINGGILQLINQNQIANTSNVTISSGIFDLNAKAETINSLTFDSGALTQGGALLTLQGSSNPLTMRNTTISGPISLSASTGDIVFDSTNNGTAVISGPLTLSNNSTRSINVSDGASSTDMNISGIISGSGANIAKTGNGTLQFSGIASNTYSGLTTISGGALQLNKSAGLDAIAGNILINGGTLQLLNLEQINNLSTVTITSGLFDLNNKTESFQELIYTGGSLINLSTLTLSNPGNTFLYMGGVTLPDPTILLTGPSGGADVVYDGNGTAVIAADIDLGGVERNFQIAGTVDPDNPIINYMNISGNITNGSIEKTGPGTLITSGPNNIISQIDINDGGLQIEGNVTVGDVNINALGTLLGRGTIITSTRVMNSGTLHPDAFGTELDIQTINGNYIQTSSGKFFSNFDTDGKVFDKLVVDNGSVNLDGNLTVDFVNASYNVVNDNVLIDNSGGTGINGTFSTVNFINLPANVSVLLDYSPNLVELLFNVTIKKYVDITKMFFASVDEEHRHLLSRLYSEGRVNDTFIKNSSKKDLLSKNTCLDEEQYVCSNSDKIFRGKNYKEGKESKDHYNISISLFKDSWSMNQVMDENGLHAKSSGIVGSFEYYFSRGILGTSVTYQSSKEKVENDWGMIRERSLRANIYSSIFLPYNFTLYLLFGGGKEYLHINRIVNIETNNIAMSNPSGLERNSLLGMDYSIDYKNLSIVPTLYFDYAKIHLDKYTAHGSDKINNYTILKQGAHGLFSNIGLRASYLLYGRNIKFLPELHFFWQKNLSNNTRNIKIQTNFLQGALIQEVIGRGKDFYNFGCSLDLITKKKISLKAEYDFIMNKNLKFNSVFINLGKDF
ncbi:MAG: autotransporter-associated beta strand repeat-containing protein [Parachlamydiales bacterium]|jgi:autotransporter-associated beta strand protein